jgi:hypothetical protein
MMHDIVQTDALRDKISTIHHRKIIVVPLRTRIRSAAARPVGVIVVRLFEKPVSIPYWESRYRASD